MESERLIIANQEAERGGIINLIPQAAQGFNHIARSVAFQFYPVNLGKRLPLNGEFEHGQSVNGCERRRIKFVGTDCGGNIDDTLRADHIRRTDWKDPVRVRRGIEAATEDENGRGHGEMVDDERGGLPRLAHQSDLGELPVPI